MSGTQLCLDTFRLSADIQAINNQEFSKSSVLNVMSCGWCGGNCQRSGSSGFSSSSALQVTNTLTNAVSLPLFVRLTRGCLVPLGSCLNPIRVTSHTTDLIRFLRRSSAAITMLAVTKLAALTNGVNTYEMNSPMIATQSISISASLSPS